MTARGWWKAATAPRTTVVLLGLLAVMLLLNVVVPQEAVVGPDQLARLVSGRPTAQFFLVTLGLSRLATSPLFIAVLALFFFDLAAVLVARAGPTVRRTRMRRRSARGLATWARMEESLSAALPESWEPARLVRVFQGFGYRARRVGERTFWGVKHRTAPLGFLLFHLSFFLLCAGGMAIYLTRFVGTAVVTEGQEFSGDYQQVLRRAPWEDPPDLAFVLDAVEPRFEDGEPVHLGATLSFLEGGSSIERHARVNGPARWGPTSVLVQAAGVAPVLWLQDAAGFTLDRVAVSARTRSAGTGLGDQGASEDVTVVPLAGGRLTARIEPLGRGVAFPRREDLASTPLRLTVERGRAESDEEEGGGAPEVLFSGTLRPGEAALLGGGERPVEGRLVLEELRYWAGLQIVRERGGGLLIAGFLVGVLGLVWRFLLHRREVVVDWDEDRAWLVGRSEYFSGRFRRELGALFAELTDHGEGRER